MRDVGWADSKASRLWPVEMDMPVDPNEPVYCTCRKVSFGLMVGCDNEACPVSLRGDVHHVALTLMDICCMCLSLRVCMYVCMYVCMCARLSGSTLSAWV